MSAPVYVLSGGGYGHGVGLNQYGALGQAKANRTLPGHPRLLLPGHGAREGDHLDRAGADRRRASVGQDRFGGRLHGHRRIRHVTPLPAGEIVLKPDLKVPVAGKPKALPGPLSFTPAKGSTLTLDGKGYRGELRVDRDREKPSRSSTSVALDAVHPRRRPGRDAEGMARCRAPGAGRRGSLLRAREPRQEPRLRSLRRPAQPDVLRRRGRVAGDDRSRQGDDGRDPHLRRQGRDDVLLLVLGWSHRVERGRLRARAAVSPVPFRPVGHGSPYHSWPPRSFTATTLAAAFGLSAPVVDVVVVPTASGRPASVTLIKKTGEKILLKAADVRARLGLRSTAFKLGVLRVGRPPATSPAGKPVVVSGSRATSRRRCSRSSSPTAAGFPPSRWRPMETACSPSRCARGSRRRTGSLPTARLALR